MSRKRSQQAAAPPEGPRTAAVQSPSPPRYNPFLFPALLMVLTVVAYAQVFSCGFIEAYDDEEFVTQNFAVLKGLTLYGVKWSLTSFMTGNWHPLTWWSHMADVTLFGLNPAGHHATSLALHILNTMLLYYFLLRTTGFRGRSFAVAALFALHPLHVESAAWIAERKDLLSTAFGLGALHLYARYVRTRRKGAYLAMLALFCLSLMAKPMLVTLPFLLLLLDYWPLNRLRDQSLPALVREKLPLFLPVLAISAVTLAAQKSVGAMMERTLPARIASALDAYLVYLRKLVAPYDLTAFYPYVPVSLARSLLAALFLAVLSVCVWHCRQRGPWLVTGWLWFLGLLVPVIGLVSVGAQAYADRYTYLPSVGVFIMAVWSAGALFDRPAVPVWAGPLSAAVVLTAFTVVTWQQVGYWKDGFSLYGRELAVVNGNWHAHLNLGTMMVERKRYDEGIAHYHEALRNNPPSEANLDHNLGVAYERKGDAPLARSYFSLTMQLAPGRDRGYLGLARVLSNSGDMAGALAVIREGIGRVPDNGLLIAKEAYLLHKTGNIAAAVTAYRQAIAKEPDLVQNYVNLGILLARQGNRAELATLVARLRQIDFAAADELARLPR